MARDGTPGRRAKDRRKLGVFTGKMEKVMGKSRKVIETYGKSWEKMGIHGKSMEKNVGFHS